MDNRSIPPGTFIPVLLYEDVGQAVTWLCAAFGFRERLRIGNHRAQLAYGDGAMVVAAGTPAPTATSVMVRVDDVDAHHARLAQSGARIVSPPSTHPFGERQYSARDLAGYLWTFTQSVADVDPAEWGGMMVNGGGDV